MKTIPTSMPTVNKLIIYSAVTEASHKTHKNYDVLGEMNFEEFSESLKDIYSNILKSYSLEIPKLHIRIDYLPMHYCTLIMDGGTEPGTLLISSPDCQLTFPLTLGIYVSIYLYHILTFPLTLGIYIFIFRLSMTIHKYE